MYDDVVEQGHAALVHTYELGRRHDCVAALQGCLHRMRNATTVDELATQVPMEVASLGFGRALFSWVDQARWVPVSFHTAAGPAEARAVMEAGSPPYWHTRDLLEAEMIRLRRPMLVHDALGNPHVHQDIQAVMHSRSYVAAPIVRDTSVIAFVHADQSVERGRVDAFDRDLLSAFAEGLGLALDRVSTQEELALLRTRAATQAAVLRDLAADLDGDRTALSRHYQRPDEPLAVVRTGGAWEDGLTRREEQVLQLLADGRTNVEIAARLYITESTAKTHVKHVLRKLGATNRAQAGALYRGSGR
jgi:DNA-binding CsgD family transcriptional regulator